MDPADSPLWASALDIADRVRKGQWSAREVVDAHIGRIERVNGKINALVAERFEAARAEASAKDDERTRARDASALPSLFGVPCSIKEFLEVEGMPQTAGLVARRGIISSQDATVVARLKKAGAIVLGVSNVPEGGMWVETLNHVYGRTSNPWNIAHTSGGSSGGEGALIAAGGAPFGIGSDIAGSIRIPASFCGAVGHKPTGRRVPNTGHWGANPETGRYLVCGPIGRSVADVAHVLKVISGPDGKDILVRDFPTPVVPPDRNINVFTLKRMGVVRASQPMRHAVNRARTALERHGLRVKKLDAPIQGAFALWSTSMEAAMDRLGASFYEFLGCGEPIDLAPELIRSMLGRSRYTFPALGLVALEQLSAKLPKTFRFNANLAELQERLEETLGSTGVLVLPPYRRSAPRHGAALLTPFDFLFCGVFSVLEFPSTVVPTGFDDTGLPVGVQVVARRGNDELTLAVARIIEQELGGWRRAEP